MEDELQQRESDERLRKEQEIEEKEKKEKEKEKEQKSIRGSIGERRPISSTSHNGIFFFTHIL